jgi:hypothetical protein
MFHRRFHAAPCRPAKSQPNNQVISESPDQQGHFRGGDDGTRTHDPLLANSPDPDIGGH